MAIQNIFRDIPYGEGSLQKVDLYVPTGTPRGVILFVHPGGWQFGSKSASGFTIGQAAYTNNSDADMVTMCETHGYVVVSMNYRLASGAATGYGGSNDGYNLAPVVDVKFVLSYIMIGAASYGSFAPTFWEAIHNYATVHGLFVVGVSSGAQLALMGVGEWGTEGGGWPSNGVGAIVPPLDIDIITQNSPYTPQLTLDLVNNYTQNGTSATMRSVSPYYKYNGTWNTAVKTAPTKFYFLYNTNDSLVVPGVMTTPMINQLTTDLGANRVKVTTITEGTINLSAPDHNVTSSWASLVNNLASQAFALSTTLNLSQVTFAAKVVESVTPVSATGGAGALTYSISPSLPAGLAFDRVTGVISGTATIAVSPTTYSITVTDTAGKTSSKAFTLTVEAQAPAPEPAPAAPSTSPAPASTFPIDLFYISAADALSYIASYSDLITTFGIDYVKGQLNYVTDPREITFNPIAYLNKYSDIRQQYGYDTYGATIHYITTGYYEGRTLEDASKLDPQAGGLYDERTGAVNVSKDSIIWPQGETIAIKGSKLTYKYNTTTYYKNGSENVTGNLVYLGIL